MGHCLNYDYLGAQCQLLELITLILAKKINTTSLDTTAVAHTSVVHVSV